MSLDGIVAARLAETAHFMCVDLFSCFFHSRRLMIYSVQYRNTTSLHLLVSDIRIILLLMSKLLSYYSDSGLWLLPYSWSGNRESMAPITAVLYRALSCGLCRLRGSSTSIWYIHFRLPQNRYFPLLCYPVIIYGKYAALSVAPDYVEVDALLRKPTTRQIGRHQYVTIYLQSIAQACWSLSFIDPQS